MKLLVVENLFAYKMSYNLFNYLFNYFNYLINLKIFVKIFVIKSDCAKLKCLKKNVETFKILFMKGNLFFVK